MPANFIAKPKPLRIPVAQKSGSLDSDVSTPQDSPLDLSLKSSTVSPKTISDRFVSIITESLTSTTSSAASIPLFPLNLTTDTASDSSSPRTPRTPQTQHYHPYNHVPVFNFPPPNSRPLLTAVKTEPDCSPPLITTNLAKSPITPYSPHHPLESLKFTFPPIPPPEWIVRTISGLNSQRPDYRFVSIITESLNASASNPAGIPLFPINLTAEVSSKSSTPKTPVTSATTPHRHASTTPTHLAAFDIPASSNRSVFTHIKTEPALTPPLILASKSPVAQASPPDATDCVKYSAANPELTATNASDLSSHRPDYTCPVCSQMFSMHEKLVKHIASRHRSRQHEMTAKNFEQLANSDLVVKTVSDVSGQRPDYTCQICSQVFSLQDRLAKHVASRHRSRQHETTAKTYVCEVCKRSFARSDMLTRHMRLHTGIKPYTCRVCGQVFSRSDHLSTHQRTHTGEKPYKCPQCPYAACRRDMITRHMRTHARYELPDTTSSNVKETQETKMIVDG
ncbi:uncharacterized protein B4U80_08763 [Leptotrombidium deliense]|uniref:C2H2-type domain-containing protein n=1 Tax=Leptotrombidium deliense TaxID=299467 RepID=A0A443SS50_9ACAR|nr:uncharacterized protein B4U80_08763 [Leptotrombidium deliense]